MIIECIHRNANHCCWIILRATPMNHFMHCLPNTYSSNGRTITEKNLYSQCQRHSSSSRFGILSAQQNITKHQMETATKNSKHSLLASSLSHIVSTSTKMLTVNPSQVRIFSLIFWSCRFRLFLVWLFFFFICTDFRFLWF